MKDGQGKYFFSDGAYYEGGWKNDYKEGVGIFIHINGSKYEGI